MKKKAEDLSVGDLVRCRISAEQPYAMVTKIKPYEGPYGKLGCFGIAEVQPGVGFSLWHGQEWEVA